MKQFARWLCSASVLVGLVGTEACIAQVGSAAPQAPSQQRVAASGCRSIAVGCSIWATFRFRRSRARRHRTRMPRRAGRGERPRRTPTIPTGARSICRTTGRSKARSTRKANLSQGYRRRGVGWYRRHFRLPRSRIKGRHLELQFDGVATHAHGLGQWHPGASQLVRVHLVRHRHHPLRSLWRRTQYDRRPRRRRPDGGLVVRRRRHLSTHVAGEARRRCTWRPTACTPIRSATPTARGRSRIEATLEQLCRGRRPRSKSKRCSSIRRARRSCASKRPANVEPLAEAVVKLVTAGRRRRSCGRSTSRRCTKSARPYGKMAKRDRPRRDALRLSHDSLRCRPGLLPQRSAAQAQGRLQSSGSCGRGRGGARFALGISHSAG